MPQENKAHGEESFSLEGKNFAIASDSELLRAIDLAFDYRGDVTLALKDGSQVAGYIFNRDSTTRKLELFIKGNEVPQTLEYDQIASLSFTGEDTAFGKSWEAWAKKSSDQRQAEANRARQEALQQGHL